MQQVLLLSYYYYVNSKSTEITNRVQTVPWFIWTQMLMYSGSIIFYLIGLLPAVTAATFRGPQVTATPLSSYSRQPAGAPEGSVVQMPGWHATPLTGKSGTSRDRSIMVPMAEMVLGVASGVLVVAAEGTWHLFTVPSSINVRKATLLFAQVNCHAASSQ